jgi:N-terminal half of MaoC dehydratase
MSDGSHINDAMRDAVGAELRRRVSFPVSESDIRRWAIAVYYPEPPPPLFWDAEHAAGTTYGGIVAPEDFNPFAWMTRPDPGTPPDLGRGGWASPERQLGIEGPTLPTMINGGRTVEYAVRMRPGDVVTSVVRLGDYSERTGRLGLMLFTVLAETWTNQHGEVVKTDDLTFIRY